MIQKPFDLILVDTKDLIIKNIRESGLPLTAISMLIKEIDRMLEDSIVFALEKQKNEYDKLIKESEENKNGNCKDN
jgi:hypothetical protein